MADRRQIIERIEKLYALASGGTSPGEATAAIAMAEKLARKHGIKDSEINKHRYTKGERVKQTSRQSTYEDAARYWSNRAHSGSFWDDYTRWTKQQKTKREQEYNGWRNHYYQQTFEPKLVRADLLRETEKAYLLNVYLDERKYPWSTLPVVIVSTWIPKSQVTAQFGKAWLLNRELLLKNMRENIPWLLKNHPVFRTQNNIEFHFKVIL